MTRNPAPRCVSTTWLTRLTLACLALLLAGQVSHAQTPSIGFASPTTVPVWENGGQVEFTVKLSTASKSVITVQYATVAGTGTSPGDFKATSGTLIFVPGQTSKKITIPIVNDKTAEALESATVVLSNPLKATLNSASAKATFNIYDDDSPLPSVGFSPTSYVMTQAGGTATITVQLSQAAEYPVLITYASSNGLGVSSAEYKAVSGTLTFATGETSKTFSVDVFGSDVGTANKTILLTLSSPFGAVLATQKTAWLWIVADQESSAKVQVAGNVLDLNNGVPAATNTLKSSASLTILKMLKPFFLHQTKDDPFDRGKIPPNKQYGTPKQESTKLTIDGGIFAFAYGTGINGRPGFLIQYQQSAESKKDLNNLYFVQFYRIGTTLLDNGGKITHVFTTAELGTKSKFQEKNNENPALDNGITIGLSDDKMTPYVDSFYKAGTGGVQGSGIGGIFIKGNEKLIWTFDPPTVPRGVAFDHALGLQGAIGGPAIKIDGKKVDMAGGRYMVRMWFSTFLVEKSLAFGNKLTVLKALAGFDWSAYCAVDSTYRPDKQTTIDTPEWNPTYFGVYEGGGALFADYQKAFNEHQKLAVFKGRPAYAFTE